MFMSDASRDQEKSIRAKQIFRITTLQIVS